MIKLNKQYEKIKLIRSLLKYNRIIFMAVGSID